MKKRKENKKINKTVAIPRRESFNPPEAARNSELRVLLYNAETAIAGASKPLPRRSDSGFIIVGMRFLKNHARSH